MPLWQLALVLAVQIGGWYLATRLTETRAAHREARRAVLDQKLNEALRDLNGQRGGCGPECSEMHTETGRCEIARNR